MRRPLLLAALALIPLTAIAQEPAPPAATTAPAAPAATVAPAASMTPEQMVDARQRRMGRGGGALAAMKQAADSGADLTTLAPRIEWLTQWADELPTFFPEGTNLAGTDARPEVWSDHAGFAAAAERFRTAVHALAAPAAANDHGAFLTAWTAARATCGGCHDSYKN